jgi:hypothetical protein
LKRTPNRSPKFLDRFLQGQLELGVVLVCVLTTELRANDQRGRFFIRVFNGRIDIGSFENQMTATRPRPESKIATDSGHLIQVDRPETQQPKYQAPNSDMQSEGLLEPTVALYSA